MFSLMNAPGVNVSIWGCCGNVLLPQAHPDGSSSLLSVPQSDPLLQRGEPEGLCWLEGCRGSSALQWDVPCLHGAGDTGHKGTGPGAGKCLGSCFWASPWYLLGFDPPNASRTHLPGAGIGLRSDKLCLKHLCS